MSNKITAKNLQYESSLPPFLARLRGQATGPGAYDGPDPILAGQRRPAKPRSGSAEAEDAPVILDEDGNVVDGVKLGVDGAVKEMVGRQRQNDEEEGKAGDEDKGDGVGGEGGKDEKNEKVAGIGGGKKRKVGKVVGGEEGEDEDGDDMKEKKATKKGAKEAKSEVTGGDKASGKAKKKAKKIKLSFGDDEG